MAFAVYHMEKGKGGSGGIGRHIDRIESKYGYTTYEHSDASMRELNKEFILNEHCKKPLPKAIEDRIKEGYTQSKEIRKDAVKFQTHVLTGSHEQMKEIFSSKATADKWLKENMDWMCERYGKENIVRFTLHMDEKTPHIHAITVPITNDGRLSAKSYADGKKALRDIQTNYAQRMERFGLERGLERVGVKHESALEYYARNKKVDEYMKQPNIKPIEPKKSFLKTNIDEIYKQNQDLSMMVASFSETLNRQERKLQELSHISIKTINRNKEIIDNKDSIIDKEVRTVTDAYRKELEEKNKTLAGHQKILNSPDLLVKRIEELEKQRVQAEKAMHLKILEQLEYNVMKSVRFKLEIGESISMPEVDDLIKEFLPKEELGFKSYEVWRALDTITNRNGSKFQDRMHVQAEKMKEEIENKRQQQREEIKNTQEQERPRSRGRRM